MEIEKYLNGELDPAAKADFEEKLARDPALRKELETWKNLREGLADLRDERQVEEVARWRSGHLRQRFFRRLMLGVLVASIWGLGWLVWVSQNRKIAPPENPVLPEPPVFQNSQPVDSQPVAPNSFPEKSSPEKPSPEKIVPGENLRGSGAKRPIAERPKSKTEQNEQPLVRSAKPNLDAETNRLIDLLLKYTIQKEGVPNNRKPLDRPIWGAAVRALLQNQPAEAKPHIFDFEKTDAAEAQWLLGIALLEEGKLDEAEAVFEKISQNVGHPRRELGALALRSLRN